MVTLSRIGVSLALLSVFSLSFARPPQVSLPPVIRTATVGACSFRLTDSLGGILDDSDRVSAVSHADYNVELPRKTLPATFHIAFGCDTRDPVQVCREFAGANHTPQGWVEWYTPDQGPAPKADRVVVRELRSLNGAGAVQLQNMPESVIGPANRSLGFCLTAPNGATLWGDTIVDEFSGRHKSVEPEVMQLLRSIEFIAPHDQSVRTVPSEEVSPPGGRQ
jgi:hypothetical protein